MFIVYELVLKQYDISKLGSRKLNDGISCFSSTIVFLNDLQSMLDCLLESRPSVVDIAVLDYVLTYPLAHWISNFWTFWNSFCTTVLLQGHGSGCPTFPIRRSLMLCKLSMSSLVIWNVNLFSTCRLLYNSF